MIRRVLLLVPLVGALLLPAAAAAACAPTAEVTVDGLGGVDDELVRLGELTGAVPPSPRLIRRGGPRRERVCDVSAPGFEPLARRVVAPEGPGVELRPLPLHLSTVWNSTYPSGADDGLLWAGRGVSQLLSAGVTARYGMATATLAPEGSWSENRAFTLAPTAAGSSPWANPYYPGQIDLPQRFGAGPFATWSLGQSALRLERWNVQAGVSTENLWLGSGIRDSILLTDTAPGFPHVFLGTARPVDIWIGTLEALVFWGRLERSAYEPHGGHPLIEGLALTYSPRWVPGLSLGLGRLMLQPWDGLRFRDYFAAFQPFDKQSLKSWYGPSGDDPSNNQIAALFFRWVFPESGLEIYGEWAREDAEWSWWGFLREPDHSQAWLVGLQKVFPTSRGPLRVYTELVHLQEIRPFDNQRGVPVYYIHQNDLDLTNRGQLLGAWIGPGADSQTFAVDLFQRGGRIGGYLERVRRNQAYYWQTVEPAQGAGHEDTEIIAGARQVLAVGRAEVSWDASFGFRMNRDFLMRDEKNLRLMLGLSLPLDGGRTPPAAAATAALP